MITGEAENESDTPLVTVIGGGMLGSNLAQVLKKTTIPYKILELRPERVQSLREEDSRWLRETSRIAMHLSDPACEVRTLWLLL